MALRSFEPGSGHDWEALRSAQRCVNEHGKLFYFTTGKTVRLSLADPDLLKVLLSSNAESYAKPSFIHILGILGDGLLASSGQTWARQRQLLSLPFASKEIKTEVSVIANITNSALERWRADMDRKSGELDIYGKLLELTLTVIKRLAFGVDDDIQERSTRAILETFDRYLHNCRDLVFGLPAALPGYRFLPTYRNTRISKDRKSLSSVVERLLQAGAAGLPPSISGEDHHKVLLDLLMTLFQSADPRGISCQQVRDNGLTVLLAGHHTTASFLTWAIYMLALHPLWQERARAEVKEICRGTGVEWANLPRLRTITMILQETLRLFPPIPLLGRLSVKENSLGPYTIPKGIEILIPTAVIHRDKDLWGDDADEFVPMRFANGISKACKHITGYLPFGFGPRTCIGQTLAFTEARTVLALILRAFTWRLGPGYRHCPDISLTLQPRFDIPIILEKL